MDSFFSSNHLIHFVFADPEDCYLQKSLVRLNFSDALYLSLRKQHYQGIFFCSRSAEQVTVTFSDLDSWQLYQNYQTKASFLDLLGTLFSSTPTAPAGQNALREDALPFCRQLCQMLRGEGHLAFVLPLSLFAALFSGPGASLLPELCKLNAASAQRGNALILYAPIQASASQGYLLDPDGPFQCSPLCPELQSLGHRPDRVPLYEHLKKHLGPRCLFLNHFSRESLLLHLRYVALVARPQWLCPPKQLEKMGDFLYLWYHSHAFRLATGPLLNRNRYRNFSLLLHDLLDSTTWHAIERQALDLLQQPLLELQRRYPIDAAQPLIPADDPIAQKLHYITLSPAFTPGAVRLERFLRIRSEAETPSNHLMPPALVEMSKTFVDSMDVAAAEQDGKTFDWGLTALEFCYCPSYLSLSDQLKICDSYRVILELSHHIALLEQQIEEEAQIIFQFTQERDQVIQKLNFEKRVRGIAILSESDLIDYPSLQLLADQACRLNNQIKNRQKSYSLKQSKRQQSNDVIWQFDAAISHLLSEQSPQFGDTLKSVMDHIHQKAKSAKELDWSIQEVDAQFDCLSHSPQDTSHHLAEEYEMMYAASLQVPD